MKTQLRLALFTDTFTPQMNGVARTLDRLTHAVRARGGEVITFTTTDPDAVLDPTVHRFESIPFWAYPQLRLAAPMRADIIHTLREFRPTLMHAATPFGVGLAGRAVALSEQVPFVTSYHTSFSAYAQYYHLGALSAPGWTFLRWFHNSGTRTYCPSNAIEHELSTRGFTNVAIWSRGVDTTRFAPSFRSSALRASIRADNDTIVIGDVGRIALEKGVDVALDAIVRVLAHTTRAVEVVFVGDGPYEEACRARELPHVHFVGRQVGGALSAWYASMDLFLFPSTTDTFGNVLLEAAASQVPIVAADVGPTRELFGNSAVLFPAGDAEGCAAAILTTMADDLQRRQLGYAAHTIAQTRTWDAVFDMLVQDYERVILAGQ